MMGVSTGLLGYIFIYVLGGLTFLPLLALAILLHAYITLPVHSEAPATAETHDAKILLPGDDLDPLRSIQKILGNKFQPRNNHEADVAEGWFAVCRDFQPGGVNGKPPERTTPIGSTTVSAASPSVYQSMYRSIFDRKQNNGPLDNKGAGRPQRRGGNVFYVVLRHGHLMLFDDDEQIEVRHVVSLAHHNVSIYSGEDQTSEGELFIKRNAICLSRKLDAGDITPDGIASKPFFFFSENCSDKEDFYFALLRNQERHPQSAENPPIPLQYDLKDIITLVQRLHSSEEHLQTRWINAVIGRIFLALYKTPEVENYIRAKITKKISRVKTPSFLSRIVLQKVDLGEAAPVITNPRLKDLTVDGELVVEADVRYAGNFRLEVAAVARIELGSRFKAREVNLLLAVVLKRIEGHVLLRIKPPPSNRIWITFQSMPKIDMSIEPIVSSRQITYTLILRQIENRIKEVVAESLVYPNWDDSPFHHSESKHWRGGIWANEQTEPTSDPETTAAQNGDVEEVQHIEGNGEEMLEALPAIEKSMSMPLFEASSTPGVYARKSTRSVMNLVQSKANGSSTSVDTRSSGSEQPRIIRSGSFASASSPIVGTDVTHADTFKPSSPPEHAGGAMAAIAALSQSSSPPATPLDSPARLSRAEHSNSYSSTSSIESTHAPIHSTHDLTSQPDTSAGMSSSKRSADLYTTSPASLRSDSASLRSLGKESRHDTSASSASSKPNEKQRITLAAVTNAAATAKKWGWNAIQRQTNHSKDGSAEFADSQVHPPVMGRGRPLPPPGTPLPPPDKRTKTAPIPVPKRKPLSPPDILQTHADPNNELENRKSSIRSQASPPPLPERHDARTPPGPVTDDGLLVVAAPVSEPTTPTSELTPNFIKANAEVVGDMRESPAAIMEVKHTNLPPPRLPKRKHPGRILSSSPEEDNKELPSWMAAQEEEARSRSIYVDEDSGL